MPLDPQAQFVLDLIVKSGRPAYDTLSPKEARQLFRETRPASTPEPPAIGAVRNLPAEGPAGVIPLRVYRPKGVADTIALPVFVFFHGGGWVIGDLDTHDVLCRQLTAEAGVSVVSVDYRLAPEHTFPAAADDAWAATRWIVSHATQLSIDPTRVAVGGDSAGGNLAAVVALMARDAGGPALALQVLQYPVTDLSAETRSYERFAEGYMLTRNGMRWFKGHYLDRPEDARDWRASPLLAPSVAGVAPALVITAGYDPLRDEGAAYAERLRDANVLVDYVCFGGMLHGFTPMGKLIDTGNRAVSLIAAALRQSLR